MQNNRFSYLFRQYATDVILEEETAEFYQMVSARDYDSLLKELMDEHFAEMDKAADPFGTGASLRIFNELIDRAEKDRAESFALRPASRLWPRVAMAAAAIALIILGMYFFDYNNRKHIGRTDFATQDVAPGKQGATLTLASGKKIRLSDAANGEIAEESGISVTKTVDGLLVYEIKEGKDNSAKINTLSTTKGETYTVTLPDKSKVWLNSASSLTYIAGLNERGERKVKLEGEAYFEVAKDKTHPFIVESKGQQVEVLGTRFNVNSYADEETVATTLLEGSVQVTSGKLKQLLTPGQQAINNGKSIQVGVANIAQVTDWKEGDFNLDRIDFKSAMRKIARWYDVDVVYDVGISDDIETGGWIPRSNNLSEVLKALEGTGMAKFRVKGRTVYVSKN